MNGRSIYINIYSVLLYTLYGTIDYGLTKEEKMGM